MLDKPSLMPRCIIIVSPTVRVGNGIFLWAVILFFISGRYALLWRRLQFFSDFWTPQCSTQLDCAFPMDCNTSTCLENIKFNLFSLQLSKNFAIEMLPIISCSKTRNLKGEIKKMSGRVTQQRYQAKHPDCRILWSKKQP